MLLVEMMLVLVPTTLFAVAASGKFRQRHSFRFRLIELGLLPLATPFRVTALAFMEFSISLLAIASIIVLETMLLLPMVMSLLLFTAFLMLKRPESCGCGFLELSWRGASIRNLVLMGVLLPIVAAGY